MLLGIWWVSDLFEEQEGQDRGQCYHLLPGGFGFAPAARAQLETSTVPVGQLIIPERGKPYLQLPKASSLC